MLKKLHSFPISQAGFFFRNLPTYAAFILTICSGFVIDKQKKTPTILFKYQFILNHILCIIFITFYTLIRTCVCNEDKARKKCCCWGFFFSWKQESHKIFSIKTCHGKTKTSVIQTTYVNDWQFKTNCYLCNFPHIALQP